LAALQWSALPIVGNDLVFAPVPNWRRRPWWILISIRVWSVTIESRHRPATPNATIAIALAITIARPITLIRVMAIVAAVVGIITVVTAVAPVAVAPFDIFAFDVTTLIDEVPSARITSIVVPVARIVVVGRVAAAVGTGIVTLIVAGLRGRRGHARAE
jgi:hypothetical protein